MEHFTVKHYVGNDRSSIKGNGFDGLEVGEDRQEAEEFVGWLNTVVDGFVEKEKLESLRKLNNQLQGKTTAGSPEWHMHENIDYLLHEMLD